MDNTTRIAFVYRYANDLTEVREFYGGLLGLPVTVFYDNSVIEFAAGVKLVFMQSRAPLPVSGGFSALPGWPGGEAESALCSIQCSKSDLHAIRERLAAAGATFTGPALRDGAWELRALDPQGNTVELYALEVIKQRAL